MRVATIDIGTNTVLLLIAEAGPGGLVAVEERATITRLGQGVDRTRVLHPDAIARTSETLSRYAAAVAAAGCERVAVVGTSAMRDAGGAGVLHDQVRRELGVDVRTISGDEEARLTFRGALSGLDVDGAVTVFDIGGGSTEIVRGEVASGAIEFATSIDIGGVRLTERFPTSDPPTRAELSRVRAAADDALAALPVPSKVAAPIGTAGTVTTMAAVAEALDPYDGARVHGLWLDRARLEATFSRIAALPVHERARLPGLEPKRADVIVAAASIVLAVLDRLGAGGVRVSDRGVRWGLAEQLVAP